MEPIGANKWLARAKVKQLKSGHSSDFINLPGEWHGKTKEEAEAKSRRAANEWISEREDR